MVIQKKGLIPIARSAEKLLEVTQIAERASRAPHIEAELDLPDATTSFFFLRTYLYATESVKNFQLKIVEAKNDDCPIGFTTGQEGVIQEFVLYPDALPAWKADTVRDRVHQEYQLNPGVTSDTWSMALRGRTHGDAGMIRMTASCLAMQDDALLPIPVRVTVTDKAAAQLRGKSSFRSFTC